MNQPWMRRPSTSCQRSTGATSLTSAHARHEVADLPELDAVVAAQPAGRNVAHDDVRRARPGRAHGGDASAAPRQADEGRAREVVPVARETLEASAIDLDAPQLEGALDRRGEDDPAAVGHPRGPQRQPAHQVAAHGAGGLEVGVRDQVLGMAVTRPEAPDRCLRQLATAPVASADGGDPPAVRRPRRSAPRLLPATRRELTHRPTADVDEVDVAAPAEVRVRVAVRDEGDLPAVGRPLRIGVVVVAAGQELGGAALGVDQPDAGEPLMDEARAVELVAQRVDEPRVGRAADPPACARASSRARVESAVLTTASRRPSGDQSRPSTFFGSSVSWRASPPSAKGRTQTCVPPSFGASGLPAFAPPPPAWSTAPRSTGRRSAAVRATIAASCRSCCRRSAAAPERCRRPEPSTASCDSRPCRERRS